MAWRAHVFDGVFMQVANDEVKAVPIHPDGQTIKRTVDLNRNLPPKGQAGRDLPDQRAEVQLASVMFDLRQCLQSRRELGAAGRDGWLGRPTR